MNTSQSASRFVIVGLLLGASLFGLPAVTQAESCSPIGSTRSSQSGNSSTIDTCTNCGWKRTYEASFTNGTLCGTEQVISESVMTNTYDLGFCDQTGNTSFHLTASETPEQEVVCPTSGRDKTFTLECMITTSTLETKQVFFTHPAGSQYWSRQRWQSVTTDDSCPFPSRSRSDSCHHVGNNAYLTCGETYE